MKKIVVALSVLVVLLIAALVTVVIFAVNTTKEPTAIFGATATPTRATVIATATATPEPYDEGVVVKTVQELTSEFFNNPKKYKRGTIMRVSGVVISECQVDRNSYYLSLGPSSNGLYVDIEFLVGTLGGPHAWYACSIKIGTEITIEGKYVTFSPRFGIDIEDAVLVSER